MMLVVLGLAVVMVTGCGSKQDNLTKKAISSMDKLAGILAGVKDKASAEKAVPKLEKLGEQLKSLKKEMDALELSDDDEQAMQDKYEDKLKKVGEKIDAEMERIVGIPDAVAVIMPAMMKMGKGM